MIENRHPLTLQLRASTAAGARTVAAGWLPSSEVMTWLEAAAGICDAGEKLKAERKLQTDSPAERVSGLRTSGEMAVEVVFYPVAGSVSDQRPGGVVLVLEGWPGDPDEIFGPRVQRLSEVWPGVLVPAGFVLEPALTEGEREAMFPWKLHFLHPALGLTGFEDRDAVRPWQLLAPPERITEGSWMAAVPGPAPLPALTRLTLLREVDLDQMLAGEAGGIGEAGDLREKGGVSGMLDRAAGTAKGMLGSFGAAVLGAAGNEKGAEALRKWSAKNWQEVRDRRARELNRLLDRFKKDPLEALRHAIPLTGAEARRGKAASPGWRLGSRSPDFAYQNQAGGGPVDVWEIQSAMRLELERRYREAAAREAAAGAYGRAAYIYAELLGDWARAAEMLEKAGRAREAARIYQERLRSGLQAAQCLERAGLLMEAAVLYEEAGQPEKAGDLLAALGQEEQARERWGQALMLLTDPLARAVLLESKLKDPGQALEVLGLGMSGKQKARPCFEAWFALAGRMERHDMAAARLEYLENFPDKRLNPPGEMTAGLHAVFTAYPDLKIRHAARAAALRMAGEALEENAASEDAVKLLGLLPKFEAGDRLLERDAVRFSLSRNRPPVPLAGMMLSGTQVLKAAAIIRLDGEARWQSLTDSLHGPHVAGWSPAWTAEKKQISPLTGPVRQGHAPERQTWPNFPAGDPGLRHLVTGGMVAFHSVTNKLACWWKPDELPVREAALAMGRSTGNELVLLREPATGSLTADYFGSDGKLRRSRVLDYAPAGMAAAEWFTAGHGRDLWIAGMNAVCCVTAHNKFQQTGLEGTMSGLAVSPDHLPSRAVVMAGMEAVLLLPKGPKKPLECVNLYAGTAAKPPVCVFTGDGRIVIADEAGGVVYQISGTGEVRKEADVVIPPGGGALVAASAVGVRGFAFVTAKGWVLDFKER